MAGTSKRTSTSTLDSTLDGHDLINLCGCFLPKERERRTNSVTFSEARITTFPIELGDNPCCEGLPIQMSREPSYSRVIDIDTFENWKRRERGDKKRRPSAFKLHLFQRQRLLKNLGYTIEELAKTLDETESIQRKRSRSIRFFKWRRRFIKLIPGKHGGFGGLFEKNPKPIWQYVVYCVPVILFLTSSCLGQHKYTIRYHAWYYLLPRSPLLYTFSLCFWEKHFNTSNLFTLIEHATPRNEIHKYISYLFK